MRTASNVLAVCFVAMLAVPIFQLQAATPQRLTEQYLPESTAPQETTVSLEQPNGAVIHQWGVINVKATGGRIGPMIENSALPDFVHTTSITAAQRTPRLEFSALYVHPPLMMKEPLSFDIRTGIRDGSVSGWYPYASQVSNPNPRIPDSFSSQITWENVLAGAQADTLQTTSQLWMIPRSVAAPATLKVYKPDPAGTQPDDPGTTEGEVFLYMAGAFSARHISAVNDASGRKMLMTLKPHALSSEAVLSWPKEKVHGWIMAPPGNDDPEESCQFAEIAATAASQTISVKAPDQLERKPTDVVRARLNEAFTGHGLDSDEADALTGLMLKTSRWQRRAVIVLPQSWVDSVIPLKISDAPARSPVRVFVAICEFPLAYFPQ